MLNIAVIFGLVIYLEWRYLKRYNRTRRTVRIVLGLGIFELLCMEAVYWLHDRWTVAMIIETIFAPIQKAIFTGI